MTEEKWCVSNMQQGPPPTPVTKFGQASEIQFIELANSWTGSIRFVVKIADPVTAGEFSELRMFKVKLSLTGNTFSFKAFED